MTLTIAAVDPANPADLAAYCAVADAVRANDLPGWREITPRMARLMLEHPFPGVDNYFWLAWRDGEPVGRVHLEIYTRENTDAVLADIWVVPGARRQGIGRRLWDFVQGEARGHGRRRTFCTTLWDLPEAPAPDLAGSAFAQALGFRPSLVDVTRRLELSNVDYAVLEVMGKPVAGYRTVGWVGITPEEYLPDLAQLATRLHMDAPHGDVEWDPPAPDVERTRENDVIALKRERLPYHTVAVHEATGKVVAWTLIVKEKALDWNASQQVTVVDPDHRGHRLGALVKAENLRFFRENEPTVTAIDTFNAHANSYMIAINEEMGYRPLYAWQNWQREIET